MSVSGSKFLLFIRIPVIFGASQVALVVRNVPASAGDIRDAGSVPVSGRSPRGEHGNPLQNSCLENPMGRGAWWATNPWSHRELDMTEQLTNLKC